MVGGGGALGPGAVDEQHAAAGLQRSPPPSPRTRRSGRRARGRARRRTRRRRSAGRATSRTGRPGRSGRCVADPARLMASTSGAASTAVTVSAYSTRWRVHRPVPQASSSTSPRGIEALEHPLELGRLGEPAGVGLGAAIEAALAQPPLVVLQRAGAVVVELLGEDRVVGHRAHRNLARQDRAETAPVHCRAWPPRARSPTRRSCARSSGSPRRWS